MRVPMSRLGASFALAVITAGYLNDSQSQGRLSQPPLPSFRKVGAQVVIRHLVCIVREIRIQVMNPLGLAEYQFL
jgi:hypothetical protein